MSSSATLSYIMVTMEKEDGVLSQIEGGYHFQSTFFLILFGTFQEQCISNAYHCTFL